MLRAIALCLVLTTLPAAAQQRSQPRPPPAAAAAPQSPLDIPVGAFQQRFNETARRAGMDVRAVEGRCETNSRRQCILTFGRAMGMVASLEGQQTLDDVAVLIPAGDRRAAIDGIAAIVVLMQLFAPNSDQAERGAVFNRLTIPGEDTIEARLGDARFTKRVVPGMATAIMVSRPD